MKNKELTLQYLHYMQPVRYTAYSFLLLKISFDWKITSRLYRISGLSLLSLSEALLLGLFTWLPVSPKYRYNDLKWVNSLL